MGRDTKVLIVGGGIMGLSTAWALNRAGIAAELFEQGPLPNPKGSSVDESRLIRYAYGGEAGYTRMVRDAYDAWERQFADLKTVDPESAFYHETGTLVLDTSGDDETADPRAQSWAAACRRTLTDCGHAIQEMDGHEAAKLVPGLVAEIVRDGFYLPTGGVLAAGRIVEVLGHYLASSGVKIHVQSAVTHVDPERAAVTLSDGKRLEGDAVVVAAGPWTSRLVHQVAERAIPSRQMVVYADIARKELAAWRSAPMLLDIDPEHGFYAVPPRTSNRLKIGDHRFSLTGDPDDDRTVDQREAEEVIGWAARRCRSITLSALESAKACFYTVQREERFVMEPAGAKAYVMTGFSGHGFKFGALMGETMAGVVQGSLEAQATTAWVAGLSEAA